MEKQECEEEMIRPRVTILILTNGCDFGVIFNYTEQFLYGQF